MQKCMCEWTISVHKDGASGFKRNTNAEVPKTCWLLFGKQEPPKKKKKKKKENQDGAER